ncbi:hypothetical protein [Pseudonocardia alni]|uniref:hypothetical protein n=1 Tax=Pseudonocardia alni TaxID=33907 RepID=UPI001AD6BA34|nr:hypothetical protein [Pseudonocardia alni]MBO4237195.1 hypothetical protein [Pseudonocardia alni]
MTTLLVIGSDPARSPGYDPAPVPAAPERGRDGHRAAGTGTTEVLVGPDDGLRTPPQCPELFERVADRVHRHAPGSVTASGTSPVDGGEAALRAPAAA